MSSPLHTTRPRVAASLDERRRRADAVREAASAVAIDGLAVSDGTQAVLDEWARGLIPQAAMVGRIESAGARRPDVLAARYAALLLRLPEPPITFETLCTLHRDLFTGLDADAGSPRTEPVGDVDGISLPETIPSNVSPESIPDLARVAFNEIAEGGLLGADRPTFVSRAAEFATDLMITGPFATGNGIAVRILLTALSRAAEHPLAFDGATRPRVRGAFAEAMNGAYASLIQLLDAATRPFAASTSTDFSIRTTLLRDDDIADFVETLARQHGVAFKRGPIDDFTDAVSRLADSEVNLDDTQRRLIALGRADVINGHDSVMLHAAYLRQMARCR